MSESLARARGLLAFVAAMQTEDGDFYNFIFDDHTINETGVTSQKSFGWWAARGVWAMATGCRVLASVDPALSRQTGREVRRSLPRIDRSVTGMISLVSYGAFACHSGCPMDRGRTCHQS